MKRHIRTYTAANMKLKLSTFLFAALLSVIAQPVIAEDSLRIGLPGEPETLDPHLYNLRLEETLLNDLFLGLTTFNAEGAIVPGAAKRWETSPDGLTWKFYLRDDLQWSDGRVLNAHDFVYAFRRLQDPKTAASLAYFMHMLKNAEAINSGKLPVSELGVKAPSDHILELTLEKPYPFLLERLLYPTAYPVPQHAIEAHGKQWTKPENWVSNGAYKLDNWVPRSHIAMKANSNFIETASIQQIRYIPLTSEQTAFNRYRTGEVDAINSFPVGELENLKNSPDLRQSDLLSMMYLVINTTEGPLQDPRVRQALSMAIDQSILTDKVLRSGNKPAYSFAPSLITDYQPSELPHRNEGLSARQSKARALLSEAGYPSGFKLTLRHVNGLENKKVNLAISGMWKAIGVSATLQQADIRGHFAALRQGDFQVAWAAWVGENNAEHYLSLLQSDIGNVNYGRFSNEAFDEQMRLVKMEKDAATRNVLLRSAEAIATEYYPVIPLYSSSVRRLVNPRINGWYENGRDMHQSRYLSRKED